MAISWLGIVALVALLYVIVKGVANPRTRPVVIGLGLFICLGIALLGLVQSPSSVRFERRPRAVATLQEPQKFETPPPSPPKSSARQTRPARPRVIAALGDALFQAWKARGTAPTAPAAPKPAIPSQRDVQTLPQSPEWVNAPPKMGEAGYTMSVHCGPYTTLLECVRELPKSLQSAVAEYAESSLGGEAAGVRLPDDALQELVAARWTENRPMEIDGANQDMFTLHALVVFDDSAQKQIKMEAQRLKIDRRVQGAAVVFGGVLALLAMTWGGLKWVTKRQDRL
jgi:hypothetical protein